MPPLSQSILHRELEALLEGCSAGELIQLIIDLGDEEHPRNRRPFLERIRRHRCSVDTAPTEISAADGLQTQIDSLAMEIAAIAEAEDAGWYDEEDGLGPFAELLPTSMTCWIGLDTCWCRAGRHRRSTPMNASGRSSRWKTASDVGPAWKRPIWTWPGSTPLVTYVRCSWPANQASGRRPCCACPLFRDHGQAGHALPHPARDR